MGLVPVSESPDETTLVIGASDVEPIVVAAALELALDHAVRRLFLPPFELWRLSEIAPFDGGKATTLVIGFPAPEVAQHPERVIEALEAAESLTWISEQPFDVEELPGALGVTVIEPTQTGLWPAVASALDLSGAAALLPEELGAVLNELPETLPEPAEADVGVRWRYALEAARQEPFVLRRSSLGLVTGEPPEEELVEAGYELILERRDLASTSTFHTFETTAGPGVIVMAPRTALGFYRDLVRDARRHRHCAVSVLAFDSNEPLFVDFEEPPIDLRARIDMVRSAFSDAVVRPTGTAGFVLKEANAGGLELLTELLTILAREID